MQSIIYSGILKRKKHQKFIEGRLINLKYNVRWLDSGHPWILYWNLQSLDILGKLDKFL